MQWELRTEDGRPVTLPLETVSFRGEPATIESARPPHRPGSTGRVYTRGGGEYFPSVFGLQWVKVQEEEDGELNAAVRLMARIGGSFAAALAAAYWAADSDNRARILAGWPDLIERYRRMARESSAD